MSIRSLWNAVKAACVAALLSASYADAQLGAVSLYDTGPGNDMRQPGSNAASLRSSDGTTFQYLSAQFSR